jgi:hypothetical protein
MGRSLKAWPMKRIKYPLNTIMIRKKAKKNMKEKRTIR